MLVIAVGKCQFETKSAREDGSGNDLLMKKWQFKHLLLKMNLKQIENIIKISLTKKCSKYPPLLVMHAVERLFI